MYYLDTSLLVAALTTEKRTHEIQSWLAAQPPEQLAISGWVITEFSAALSVKLRTRQLSAENRADALTMFARLQDRTFTLLDTSDRHYFTAARLADQYQTGLRAGDALHLAIAADHGIRLVTLDKGLAKAAKKLGVSNRLL